jgi:hypothetical protein
MARVINYLDVPALVRAGAGIVRFGNAPDGLPMLATVEAPPDAEGLLADAAEALGVEENEPGFVGTPLEPLADALDRILREHLIQHLTGSAGAAFDVMILPHLVRALTGGTLFERLLKPFAMYELREAQMDASMAGGPPAYTSLKEMAPPPPLPRLKTGDACLALPVEPGQPAIVRRERDAAGWPRYSYRREFQEESTSPLRAGHYTATVDEREEALHPASPADRQRYTRLRESTPNIAWRWAVPRLALARVILDLTAHLARQHETGDIHGDLKPAKILLTANGPVAIDGLGLAPGDRAPAMTRGWAAPEQVLGSAVQPQTDQYALGLLLLKLVDGVLYGEEATVSIPTGGTQLERHTVLRNPGVYIDPDTAPVARDALGGWRDLIERCVRFAAEERYSSMDALGAALRSLLASESLTDTLDMPLSFGQLVLGRDPAGEISPCWLVNTSATPLFLRD